MKGMAKSHSAKTALSVVFVIAIAAAFWLLLLSPKRDQANELKERASTLTTELASAETRANEALAAKKDYRSDYNKLLQLGKAVPADASTSSLLVELTALGLISKTSFVSISQGQGSENGGGSTSEQGEGEALPPLGATTGPSGLLAMPYSLEFAGGYFQVANFIQHLDSLVKTKNGTIDSHGRLVTIDGFELTPANLEGSKERSELLGASFSVSTYVTPPGQGLTAGATPAGPSTASYEK